MINSRHTGMIIWIIKILRRLLDTFYKQNVLSLAFRQRVGIVPIGLYVPKNPVFMRVSGLGTFQVTVFATLLQHFFSKTCFRADEIVPLGLQLNLQNRIIFKAFALLWAEAFFVFNRCFALKWYCYYSSYRI